LKLNRKISVLGLGYVGLPVAVAFGKKIPVIGFDISLNRVKDLSKNNDSTTEFSAKDLQEADIFYTTNPEDLRKADFHIIAVPTPIDQDKQPDLTHIIKVSEMVGEVLKVGDIVVYESTVYPGCTEEDCVPILERVSGLEFNKDFFVGYSPERIVPGDMERVFTKIKKVVSGSTVETLEIVASVYESVIEPGVHRAPSIAVAEAAKVIENTQRDVNIALVNELALIFDRAGIDTRSVLEAAGSKWNFHKYSPGLVGGHCIGVDPYYLVRKAGRLGLHTDLISSARRINDGMGIFIAQRTCRQMIRAGLIIKDAVVTIFGVTFKEDCPDLRNSKVPDIAFELESLGLQVQVTDPLADAEECMQEYRIKILPETKLKRASAIIVAVAHSNYSNWSLDQWEEKLIPGGVVADVKGIVPTAEMGSKGYSIWLL
jgi:UDP-N-acetyl-D-glucosamine/UDP-N-acetyl-D-galactosamine dehydrogenase